MAQTIVDVLIEVLGADLSAERVDELTLEDIAEVAQAVQHHYREWQPAETDALRVHLGGWVGGNFAAPEARDLLATMLLYADQVVLHDPLADWFSTDRLRMRPLDPIRYRNGTQACGIRRALAVGDPAVRTQQEDLERNRAHLRWAIPALRDVAPLVASGAAVLVPHLQLIVGVQDGLLSAVRHDLANDDFLEAVQTPVDLLPVTTDFSRGLRLELSNAGGLVSDKDRRLQTAGNPAYYLNKTLAVASAVHASYLPPSATDWRLYELRIRAAAEEARRATDTDLRVLAALHSSDLPLLAGLDLATVSKLRVKEGVMEEWRIALRQAARGLSTLPVEGRTFATDSRQVLADLLGPAEKQVVKESGILGRLKRTGGDASVKLVAGAAGAGASAAILGGPPVGLITAGVRAAAGWTLGALLPPKRNGVAHVVAHLRQSKM